MYNKIFRQEWLHENVICHFLMFFSHSQLYWLRIYCRYGLGRTLAKSSLSYHYPENSVVFPDLRIHTPSRWLNKAASYLSTASIRTLRTAAFRYPEYYSKINLRRIWFIFIVWLKAVQAEFEKFGVVTDVYNTGKGYAFVTFDRKEDAEMVSGMLGCFMYIASGFFCMLMHLISLYD